MKSTRIPLALALAVTTGITAFAASTKFLDFTPLTGSAAALPVDGPEEATPIKLSNSKWSQRTLADRRTQNNLVINSNSRELGLTMADTDLMLTTKIRQTHAIFRRLNIRTNSSRGYSESTPDGGLVTHISDLSDIANRRSARK